MYKKPCKHLFHIFTDNNDVFTSNWKKALRIYNEFKKDNACARLYKETNWNEEEGLFVDEDCIYSFGAFPS